MDELQMVRDFFGEAPPPDPDVVAAARARISGAGPAVERRFARRQHVKRARGWILPLGAAASVVVVVLASVIITHLASPGTTQGGTVATAQVPRPEFYLTATYPPSGPNVLRFQVRRTDGGAVTASASISAANLGWGGNITAAASDRAFFIGYYPCRGAATPDTTFYQITITGSGQISGITAVGRPVQGMITDLAVSPDGSQLAYTALPGACGAGTGFKSPAAAAVSILDLSTGTVRTWQDTNTTGREMAGGLSWTPDGGTLIVNETSRGSSGRSLTVFGLNTAGSGGSLQADSTVLLKQNADCSRATCVTAVIAGPDHSLTAIESHAPGQKQTRVQVVSIPLAAGRPQTVLYSELTGRPAGLNDGMGLFADSSGQWVLLWPTGAQTGPQHAAGWISGGTLHPLPGVAQVFPQGIAW